MSSFVYGGREYEFVTELGSGAFSNTYQYRSGKDLYTVKIYKGEIKGDKLYENEVDVLTAMSEECVKFMVPCIQAAFVVSMGQPLYDTFFRMSMMLSLDVSEDRDFRIIIYKFIDGVPLKQLTDQRKRGKLTLDIHFLTSLRDQMLKIIASLHNRGICHRDINPSNIIWTINNVNNVNSGDSGDSGQAYLIDFGVACDVNDYPEPTVGTLNYILPEVVESGSFETSKELLATDIYGLGVVLYYYITGEFPYKLESRGRGKYRVLTDVDPFVSREDKFSQLPDNIVMSIKDMILRPEQKDANTLLALWSQETDF